jgi:hypothetical protein
MLRIILHILLSLKVCYKHGGNAEVGDLIFFNYSEIYVHRNISRLESITMYNVKVLWLLRTNQHS